MAAPDFTKNQLARYLAPTPGGLDAPLDLRNLSELEKGFEAFKGETVGIGGGALALGAQQLKTVLPEAAAPYLDPVVAGGLETFQREMAASTAGAQAPKIATIEEIKGVGDLGDWAAYQAGKGLPQIAGFGVGGVIGRQLAKAGVKKGLKHLAGAEVGKKVAGKAVTQEMKDEAASQIKSSLAKGTFLGGFIPAAAYEGGAAFGEITGEGVAPEEAVGPATTVAGISGALEFTPLYQMAKRMGMGDFAQKGVREAILKDKELGAAAVELARRASGAAAVGATAEGLTEGLQELTNIAALRWAKDEELFGELTDEDWSQIANATAAGALLGGGVAGAAGPFVGPRIVEPEVVTSDAEPVVEPAPAAPAAEPTVTPAEPAAVVPAPVPALTPDAIALTQARDEDLPANMTEGLARIAQENGVEVAPTDTPVDVVSKLRQKELVAEPITPEIVPEAPVVEEAVPPVPPEVVEPVAEPVTAAPLPGRTETEPGKWAPLTLRQYGERLGKVAAGQDPLSRDEAVDTGEAMSTYLPEQVANESPELARQMAEQIQQEPEAFAAWSGQSAAQAKQAADALVVAADQAEAAVVLESTANFGEVATNVKGQPFTTRKAATLSAQKLGMENFTVDERQIGGQQRFVVRDLGPVEAEPAVAEPAAAPEMIGDVQMPVNLLEEAAVPPSAKISLTRTRGQRTITKQVNARKAVALTKRRVDALREMVTCLSK